MASLFSVVHISRGIAVPGCKDRPGLWNDVLQSASPTRIRFKAENRSERSNFWELLAEDEPICHLTEQQTAPVVMLVLFLSKVLQVNPTSQMTSDFRETKVTPSPFFLHISTLMCFPQTSNQRPNDLPMEHPLCLGCLCIHVQL